MSLSKILNPFHIGGSIGRAIGNPLNPLGIGGAVGKALNPFGIKIPGFDGVGAGKPNVGAPAPVGITNPRPGLPPLTAGSFPASGFARPAAQDYLSQVLGFGPPAAPIGPPSPVGGAGGAGAGGLAAILQQLMGGKQGVTAGQSGSGIDSGLLQYLLGQNRMRPGGPSGPISPGPAPNPLMALSRFGGPMGNGGGYYGPRPPARGSGPIAGKYRF